MAEAIKRTKKGQFAPGTCGNRGGRSAQHAPLKKEIIKNLPRIIDRVIEQAEAGCIDSQKLLMTLVIPKPRPTTDLVMIPGVSEAESPREKILAIVNEAAKGELSPDIAERLARSLAPLVEKEGVGKDGKVINVSVVTEPVLELEEENES